MNPIVECAARTLERHPHPALRLGELAELVGESLGRTIHAAFLRDLLEGCPRLFRLLDPWRGPWRDPSHTRAARYSEDPWVLLANEPAGRSAPRPSALRLRESVRWLGNEVDTRSARTVSRWYAIALAEREARAALRRRRAA